MFLANHNYVFYYLHIIASWHKLQVMLTVPSIIVMSRKSKFGYRPRPLKIWAVLYRHSLKVDGLRILQIVKVCVAKTKLLISCAVTAQLICSFVFALARAGVFFS